MKKFLALIFVVLLLFLTVSPTFALSIDHLNVEVTESEKEEIIEFLKKYNELILLGYMCEGSFEYDDSVMYGTSEEINIESDMFPDNVNEYISKRYEQYSNVGYLVTDERFNSYEELYDLVYEVFLERYSYTRFHEKCRDVYYEFFGNDPLFQDWVSDNYGESNYSAVLAPSFKVDNDGNMYTAKPINDYATLYYRYIDIESVEIGADHNFYYIFARGSSEFKNGKVSEPDSDVRMMITKKSSDPETPEPYKMFTIQSIYAKRDHIQSQDISKLTEEEMVNYCIERYDTINSELLKVDRGKIYKLDNLNTRILGEDNNNYYKIESDIFRSIVDVYDWLKSLKENTREFYNLYLTGGYFELRNERGIGTDDWAIHFPYLADTEYGLFLSETALEQGFLELPLSDEIKETPKMSKKSYFTFSLSSGKYYGDYYFDLFSAKETGKITNLQFIAHTHSEVLSDAYFDWSADTWLRYKIRSNDGDDYTYDNYRYDRDQEKWVPTLLESEKPYEICLYLQHENVNAKFFGFNLFEYGIYDTEYVLPSSIE